MAKKWSVYAITLSLIAAACTPQQINQNATVMIGDTQRSAPGPNDQFSALGGAGLDPTVIQHCQGKDITGDQGYARSVSRRYRQYLETLSTRVAGQNGGLGQGAADAPAEPSASPSARPTPAPGATATDDISVIENTTINGQILDQSGEALAGATVEIRSLNSSVPYAATANTISGIYAFNNVPAGVQLEIVVTKPGFAPRSTVIVAKSNKTGDPNANRYDFGDTPYAVGAPVSNQPEVTRSWALRESLSAPVAGLGLRFSKPMNQDSVEKSLAAYTRPDTASGELGPLLLAPDQLEFNWNDANTAVEVRFKLGPLQPDVLQNAVFGFQEGNQTLRAEDGSVRDSDYFKLGDRPFEDNLLPSAYLNQLPQREFMNAVEPGPTPSPTALPTPLPTPTPMPTALPSPEPTPLPPATKARDSYYFSYDDSASVAGVELTRQALDNGQLPDPAWARPWEFLNYENFDHVQQEKIGDFQVSLGLWKYPDPNNRHLEVYEIGAHVTAPYRCASARPLLNLTLLIDVSTSMSEPSALAVAEGGRVPTKFELLKTGLADLHKQLRKGDIVNIVAFSEKPFTLLEQYTVGEDPETDYLTTVSELALIGSTNLQSALETGYRVARQTQASGRMNRVMLLTDAHPTTGELDLQLIEDMAAQGDRDGLYLSALGLGYTQNQSLLNQVTEAGHGAYYAVNTLSDIKEAMGDRLLPLLDVIARDMRFRLEFPGWLRHGQSAAEQVSQNAADVQQTNFSANTSQYFWEQFRANQSDFKGPETVRLVLSYTDPLNGAAREVAIEKPLSELLDRDLPNIKAAHLVQLTTALIRSQVSAEQVRTELAQLLPDTGR